ncbi:MAG: redox-sensitive transcriptional activator SoxR [Rhodobacteraceae bacterium]|nr:redox-sensitive transcriptional activator SoxR [Paracoccaceae bacterium]
MALNRKEYAIGYLAQRTGLAVSAIRHYESQGLIKPNRTASGQRRFARSDIRRLSFIKIAQSLDFSLPYIRDLLAGLPDHRTPSGTDWARISKNFESVLNAPIKRLKQLRDTLNSCIGCGCLSLKSCALYNHSDHAGQHGTGAMFLLEASESDAT